MDEKTLQSVREARDKAFYDATILLSTFHWDQRTDARITTLSKIIKLLVALQLTCHSFLRLESAAEEEWSSLVLPAGDNSDRRPYLDTMELVTKTGFVASLFAAMESSFRVYLNDLDPEAYARNQSRTREIMRLLLKERLSHEYAPHFEVVDLLRNLRNTLHNNGMFYPPDGRSLSFTFRGLSHAFVPGQRVNFVTWELVIDLADTMRSISFQLARDEKIGSVPGVLADPSALI